VALADGTVDAIATDHAPHASHEKEMEFELAAFGHHGTGKLRWHWQSQKLHREKRIPLARVVELFTAGPGALPRPAWPGIAGLAATFADVTIFDPKKKVDFRGREVSLQIEKIRPLMDSSLPGK